MKGAMLHAMDAARKVTLEEWEGLDHHDVRELVDGVLVAPEMTGYLHDAVQYWLGALLHVYFIARGGSVAGSCVKLVIGPDRGRVPDILCYAKGRRPNPEGLVRLAPDIAVEVITPRPRDARRDRVEKPRDYAKMGIKQYWLVDPKLRTFEIWRLDKRRRYEQTIAVTSGVVRVPGFKGLRVDVDALWAHVDALSA
jgi:Uma2 family endonuclease